MCLLVKSREKNNWKLGLVCSQFRVYSVVTISTYLYNLRIQRGISSRHVKERDLIVDKIIIDSFFINSIFCSRTSNLYSQSSFSYVSKPSVCLYPVKKVKFLSFKHKIRLLTMKVHENCLDISLNISISYSSSSLASVSPGPSPLSLSPSRNLKRLSSHSIVESWHRPQYRTSSAAGRPEDGPGDQGGV